MARSETVSIEGEVNIEIRCSKHNKNQLDFESDAQKSSDLDLTVDPCEDCLEEARQEGRDEEE